MDRMKTSDDWVVLGEIAGAYGIKGWVRVRSHTQPQENILEYPTWWVGPEGARREMRPLEARPHGKGLVARLDGVADRDAAEALHRAEVAIPRDALPELGAEEYYWAELIGLEVRDQEDRLLGRVDHLLETGANDVLVVHGERERLIPYVRGQVVKAVDLDAGCIRVDWDAEF